MLADAIATGRSGPGGSIGGPTAPQVTLVRTSAAHLPSAGSVASGGGSTNPDGGGQARVVRATGTTLRNDGNNVDIDAEMAMLAENTIYYQALVQQLNNSLGLLRLAITEGRR